jgi:hypothetical protein
MREPQSRPPPFRDRDLVPPVRETELVPSPLGERVRVRGLAACTNAIEASPA